MSVRCLALVPARQGSKRIPGKNVRPFAGKPLLAYPIEAARRAGVFDEIVVSTDSPEIAGLAEHYGATAPFLRPAELADDHTPTADVIAHALRWLLDHGHAFTYACCIYANPLVAAHFLKEGLASIQGRRAGSAFAVTTFEFPIFRSLRINEAGCLEMLWPEHELTRSQDLPEAYHDAGQFYWVDVARFLECPRLYAKDAAPVLLPRVLVQDLDTLEDWDRTEALYQICRNKEIID